MVSLKRLPRVLLCLVLVVALLFAFVPMQVNASAAVIAGVSLVPGLNVAAAILLGVGVVYMAASTDWDTVAYNLNNWFGDQGLLNSDGEMSVYKSESGQYYVDQAVIESSRQYLFDSNILTVSLPTLPSYGFALPAGGSVTLKRIYSNIAYNVSAFCNVFALNYGSGYARVVFLSKDPTFSVSGTIAETGSVTSSGEVFYYAAAENIKITSLESLGYTCYDYSSYTFAEFVRICVPSYREPFVTTTLDLELQNVVVGSLALDEAYEDWGGLKIVPPEDDQDPIPVVWPLGLPNDLESAKELTQEDVQSGVGNYVEPEPEPDPGTGTDSGISQTWLGSMFQSVVNVLNGIWTSIINLPDSFANWFNELILEVKLLPESFKNWFEEIIQWVKSIPELILGGIESIFVPSEDFLTDKVNALRENFVFADSIITSGEYIGNSLKGMGTEPPVIYINLGNNRGPYNMGGEVAFLDLRWYEEYKPVGDAIISAFLWLMFVWRVYIKAPGIIRGIPGDVGEIRDMSGKD